MIGTELGNLRRSHYSDEIELLLWMEPLLTIMGWVLTIKRTWKH